MEESMNSHLMPCEREECTRLRGAMAKLRLYFTSGNTIPVERATILGKDFWEILGEEPD